MNQCAFALFVLYLATKHRSWIILAVSRSFWPANCAWAMILFAVLQNQYPIYSILFSDNEKKTKDIERWTDKRH